MLTSVCSDCKKIIVTPSRLELLYEYVFNTNHFRIVCKKCKNKKEK